MHMQVSWIAIVLIAVALVWLLWSWARWNFQQRGNANELDWLDELVREHQSGKRDRSETIRRLIVDIERGHDPSPMLERDLRRAREAIEKKT